MAKQPHWRNASRIDASPKGHQTTLKADIQESWTFRHEQKGLSERPCCWYTGTSFLHRFWPTCAWDAAAGRTKHIHTKNAGGLFHLAGGSHTVNVVFTDAEGLWDRTGLDLGILWMFLFYQSTDCFHAGAEFALSSVLCLTRWWNMCLETGSSCTGWWELDTTLSCSSIVLIRGRVSVTYSVNWIDGWKKKEWTKEQWRDKYRVVFIFVRGNLVSAVAFNRLQKILWNETFHLVYILLLITHENRRGCLSSDSQCYFYAAALPPPPPPTPPPQPPTTASW